MPGICGAYAIIKYNLYMQCIVLAYAGHIQSICLAYTFYLFYFYFKKFFLPYILPFKILPLYNII